MDQFTSVASPPLLASHPVDVLDVVHADRVVAMIRASRVPDPVALADAFAEGGIRCVEFTFTIPDVLPLIRSATSGRAYIGAGTVLHPEQARSAIDAGASFIVSPAMRPEMVSVCRDAGVPVVLGALTPTEVAAAADAGASAIKIFPAGLGGPRYIRDLRGPLKALRQQITRLALAAAPRALLPAAFAGRFFPYIRH